MREVLELRVEGVVTSWRGPAPWHFLTFDEESADAVAAVARDVTYGWGAIPVRATVGCTTVDTALFPHDGSYELPLKAALRRAEGLELGGPVSARVVVLGP